MSKYIFGDIEAEFFAGSDGRKVIHVEWSFRRTRKDKIIGGFGESQFYVINNSMYSNSEYMSKEFESEVLKLVYAKYGKPEWALDDFKHGHWVIENLGEPSVFVEFE